MKSQIMPITHTVCHDFVLDIAIVAGGNGAALMMKDTTASNDRQGAAQEVTPEREDIAGLYTFANLEGTEYRDFSASREKARADTRNRNAVERLDLAEANAPKLPEVAHSAQSSVPRPADIRPIKTMKPPVERTPAAAPGPRRLQAAEIKSQRSPARAAPSRWVALKNVLEKESDHRDEEELSVIDLGIPALAFASLAGGVGKTSLVASLGGALAEQAESVLLVDTHAYSLLPLSFAAAAPPSGSSRRHADASAAHPIQIITMDEETREEGAPAGLPLVDNIVRKAYGMNRILVDVTTGSTAVLRQVLRLSPTVLVILNPDMASVVSLHAVESLFEKLAEETGRPIELFYVLNRFDPSMRLDMDVRAMLTRQLGDRLLPVVIHRDSAVSEALAEGTTVMEYAPDAQIVEDINSFARWVRELDEPATAALPSVRWRER